MARNPLPTSFNAGIDTSVIALWMGHENIATTQVYIHADLALKERAIARTAPQDTPPGRYQPPDAVLAFLTDCDYAGHPQPATLTTTSSCRIVGITTRSA